MPWVLPLHRVIDKTQVVLYNSAGMSARQRSWTREFSWAMSRTSEDVFGVRARKVSASQGPAQAHAGMHAGSVRSWTWRD